nr:translation initiation factor 2 [uncultured Agathobaculum sp.]
MVKGISRRVVVVRPDGHAPFEQAIFLVRDCAVPRRDAVREACRIANGYLGRRPARRAHRLRLLAAFAAGAAASSLVWAAVWLLL